MNGTEIRGRAYNMTWKSNFLKILPTMVMYLFLVAFLLIQEEVKDIQFIMIVIPLLGPVPVLILHIEYFIQDWRSEIIIDDFTGRLRYKKKNIVNEIEFNQIASITKVSSIWFLLPFSGYWFYKIYLRNNDEIIVTCLSVPSLKVGQKQIYEEKVHYPLLQY